MRKLASVLRMRIAQQTDRRVGIMNEILQGIQIIKMYAWEKPFEKVVAEARRLEIKQISYLSYIHTSQLAMIVYHMRVLLCITIVACVLLNKTLTADVVFSMTQLFYILEVSKNSNQLIIHI